MTIKKKGKVRKTTRKQKGGNKSVEASNFFVESDEFVYKLQQINKDQKMTNDLILVNENISKREDLLFTIHKYGVSRRAAGEPQILESLILETDSFKLTYTAENDEPVIIEGADAVKKIDIFVRTQTKLNIMVWKTKQIRVPEGSYTIMVEYNHAKYGSMVKPLIVKQRIERVPTPDAGTVERREKKRQEEAAEEEKKERGLELQRKRRQEAADEAAARAQQEKELQKKLKDEQEAARKKAEEAAATEEEQRISKEFNALFPVMEVEVKEPAIKIIIPKRKQPNLASHGTLVVSDEFSFENLKTLLRDGAVDFHSGHITLSIFINNITRCFLEVMNHKKKKYVEIQTVLRTQINRQIIESEAAAREQMLPGEEKTYVDRLQSLVNDIRKDHYTILADTSMLEIVQNFISKIDYNIANGETYKRKLPSKLKLAAISIGSILGDARAKVRDELANYIFLMSKNSKIFTSSFFNICVTGGAGLGKTGLSQVIATIFSSCGFLLKDGMLPYSPQDFKGGYVGQSGMKTASLLQNGLEQVILIDEAYNIMSCKGSDDKVIDEEGSAFGYEAITELVNFLDKRMGLSIIIVAGYEKSINACFFKANEGLERRFPIRIQLDEYTDDDLTNILCNFIQKNNDEVHISLQMKKAITNVITKMKKKYGDIFKSQAGDMLNLSTFISSNISINGYSDAEDGDEQTEILKKSIVKGFEKFRNNKTQTRKISKKSGVASARPSVAPSVASARPSGAPSGASARPSVAPSGASARTPVTSARKLVVPELAGGYRHDTRRTRRSARSGARR